MVSSLTVEQINDLSDEQVMNLAMPRPSHPGQFGFVLNPRGFQSMDHLAETMVALLNRLGKVENLEEKMGNRMKDSSVTSLENAGQDSAEKEKEP